MNNVVIKISIKIERMKINKTNKINKLVILDFWKINFKLINDDVKVMHFYYK